MATYQLLSSFPEVMKWDSSPHLGILPIYSFSSIVKVIFRIGNMACTTRGPRPSLPIRPKPNLWFFPPSMETTHHGQDRICKAQGPMTRFSEKNKTCCGMLLRPIILVAGPKFNARSVYNNSKYCAGHRLYLSNNLRISTG